MKPVSTAEGTASALYFEAESQVNRDNTLYLLILAVMLAFAEGLNEIGLFVVPPLVMRLGAALGVACFLTPR